MFSDRATHVIKRMRLSYLTGIGAAALLAATLCPAAPKSDPPAGATTASQAGRTASQATIELKVTGMT